MARFPEIVVTGLGVVCPIGIGRDPFWAALDAGQSGIGWLPKFEGSTSPFRFAGLIRGFDAKEYVQPRKTIKVMCEEIQAAYAAAVLATRDAGLAKGTIAPERLGVVMGSEMFYGDLDDVKDAFRHCVVEGEFQNDLWGHYAFHDLFPLWMLKFLPNIAACHISIAQEALGPNNSIIQGGVSSLLAIQEGMRVLERGLADVMLVGGSGSFCSMCCLPFRGSGHLSRWPGEPSGASRPFEARRSGIVPGGGAATFVLETRASAERRGASVLARVLGGSSRFEPTAHGQPLQGTAIRASIEQALAASGLQPGDIGHVNANGDGSVLGDRIEAQAIAATLGQVPVTAPKSYFGDLSAGSGAVEMAASVLALVKGRVPPTLNYETPDPACPINVVHGQPLAGAKPTALLLSQSTTGQAAALVIAAP